MGEDEVAAVGGEHVQRDEDVGIVLLLALPGDIDDARPELHDPVDGEEHAVDVAHVLLDVAGLRRGFVIGELVPLQALQQGSDGPLVAAAECEVGLFVERLLDAALVDRRIGYVETGPEELSHRGVRNPRPRPTTGQRSKLPAR